MPVKQPHEEAIDEYEDADKAYNELETRITSGDVAAEIAVQCAGRPDDARDAWNTVWTQLRNLLDDRNAKYSNAANLLRQAVMPDLSQGQKWRGTEGRAETVAYGKLRVSTRTKRTFVGDELIKLAERKGILDQLEQLTYIDDKSGAPLPMVKTEVSVQYRPMLQWLRDHGHDDIINGAYEEEEMTPAVEGAKPIAFLGQPLK
jgi:hypothetical protein